jgi:outer membrane protein assembly factor BamB
MTRVALTLAAILAVTGLHAEDYSTDRLDNWPHWRGPLATGAAPRGDPPVTWDEQKNVKWKAPLQGKGSSTPIVWGEKVFVLTSVETDRVARPEEIPKVQRQGESKTSPPNRFHRFDVVCLDRGTGQVRWRRTAAEEVPHEGHHQTHSYCAGSPTTDGKYLYFSFGSFGTYCYDLDGNLVWKRDLGRQQTRYAFGEAVTPALHGNSLVLNWDQDIGGAVYCLDARTGEIRWKVDRNEESSWNTPLIVEHNGRAQVILNATKRIRSYDLETGKELWQCGGMSTNAIPSPIAVDGVAYVMSGYNGSLAVAVPLDATGDLTNSDKLLWRHTRGTPYVPSPVFADGRLYFLKSNNALFTVLDAKTGKPIIDGERLPQLKNELYASPVVASGRVYIVDRAGTTLVLKQGDKLEVLATNRLNDPIDASPVVVGKQLFLRSFSNLYCIENP